MKIYTIKLLFFRNPLVSCNDYDRIPSIDLNFWKEEPYGNAAPQYGAYADSYKKKWTIPI